VKKSLLVEADGGPLAVTIAGANVPDARLLDETIRAIVLERPAPEPDWPQHLCLDKGYDNDTGWGACIDHEYEPHIALIRDERPPRPQRYPARRWVVERTIAWLHHDSRPEIGTYRNQLVLPVLIAWILGGVRRGTRLVISRGSASRGDDASAFLVEADR